METTTITISKEIVERLKIIDGDSIEAKLVNLLKKGIVSQLKECEDFILNYETKYGMSYEQFKILWGKSQIENKYSHESERDCMEWEGFQHEREKWLKMLRELKDLKTSI
ncbi:MAG: hypothetical protein FJ264_15190 [Planctomycetes bacterium]|nr:hypothetical protein [Planctomycetota bacterium]